jgi:hypothetical protein
MLRIFVNYRTGDEETCAVLVERELSNIFGGSNVFLASKSIPPGARFEERLLRGVWRSDALVAVIGKRWLDAPNIRGELALDSAEDWTRREIVEAFSHDVVVIPLLVGGVGRLRREDLPAALADLAEVQYVRFDHRNPDAGLRILRERLSDLDDTHVASSECAEGEPARRCGIGSITGRTVNAVTDPRGPVNIGSGHQVNQPDFAGDGTIFVLGGEVNDVRQRFGSRRGRS